MAKPRDASQSRQILRERARVLARPLEEQREVATLEVLEFRLAEERYAIAAAAVRDVHPLRGLSPLPCTPEFMAGLVNIRGRIVPVIDIKRFLDLPQRGIADLHHVVLVGDEHLEIGLLADAIEGVHAIDADSLRASVSSFPEARDGYFRGIAPDRLVVLDIEAILGDERLVVGEEVEI